MAYYATELAVPPPKTITAPGGGTAVIQEKVGTGYPVGTPQAPTYFPNSPTIPPVATNPHGIANSPGEYPAIGTPPASIRYAYSFQTFEEKIAGTGYVPSVPVVVAANEPYPTAA